MNEPQKNAASSQRNHPVHHPVIEPHNRSIIVFLTVCTKSRRPLLANEQFHRALRQAWAMADHWLVGRYVLMPDHLHLFCAPGMHPIRSLANWVRFWKASASKATGATEGMLWQADFWDTQLRRHESYSGKWEYVRNNPVRAGLSAKPEDWPYQGELNLLRWHD